MKTTILTFAIALLCSLSASSQERVYTDEDFVKAIELVINNQNEEALELLNGYIEAHPLSADALYARARVYAQGANFADAYADISKAVVCWDKSCVYEKSLIYCWRADIAACIGEYRSSLSDYNEAYALVAGCDSLSIMPRLLYCRAEVYYNLGDYENADKDYTLLQEYEGRKAVAGAGVGFARNALARGECEKAVLLLDELEKEYPDYGEVYRYRMQAYDKMGETRKAIDDAVMFFCFYPNSENELVDRILVKNLSYAISKVEEVEILTGAAVPELRRLLAFLYVGNRDFRNAVFTLNTYEKDFGAVPPLYTMRGECYMELGFYDRAIKDFEKSLEVLSPSDGGLWLEIMWNKATSHRRAGQYKDAIKECSSLIEDSLGITEVYYLRGWCHELMGDDEAAMRDYNKGIEVSDYYAYIYLMRGEQYLKRGDIQKATADFEQVLKLDTVPEMGSCRHFALHFLGNDKEALEWMEKVADACKHDAGSYYDKACLLARMGRTDEAVAALAVAFEKGYRAFVHIENDDDMNPIRERKDFKDLVEKYKALMAAEEM